MFASERQKIILETVNKRGSVSVSELTEQFGVSVETVRRDLLLMEKEKMLYRVHGGAVKLGEMKHYASISDRLEENNMLKEELCRKSMAYIEEGDIISVDSGSTAVVFAETLKKHFSSLTVVTQSLNVFNILCNYKEFKVILCAGQFNREENTFFGPLTVEMLKKVYTHKAFIFPAALSLNFGLREHSFDAIEMQRAIIANSDRVFVLADSSKFECKEFYKTEDMLNGFTYITDSSLPTALKNMYTVNGINIVC